MYLLLTPFVFLQLSFTQRSAISELLVVSSVRFARSQRVSCIIFIARAWPCCMCIWKYLKSVFTKPTPRAQLHFEEINYVPILLLTRKNISLLPNGSCLFSHPLMLSSGGIY